jgi:hypothetical protein
MKKSFASQRTTFRIAPPLPLEKIPVYRQRLGLDLQ